MIYPGGLSELAWEGLTPEERVIQYNRHLPVGCDHPADIKSWPEGLRESFSHDPYFHTAHMVPHGVDVDVPCECQTCEGHFGRVGGKK